jgi:hypothetical protein
MHMDNRRCRAEIVYNELAMWRPWQCENRARTTRRLMPEGRELPVCGIHARSNSAHEYRPRQGDRLAVAVEAVVRTTA